MPEDRKGKGWFGNSQQHAAAGRKGGLARKRQIESDPEMSYQLMGRKGGEASSGKFQKGSNRAREAGRKGGRASH